MVLKIEDGANSQGIQSASRSMYLHLHPYECRIKPQWDAIPSKLARQIRALVALRYNGDDCSLC